MLYYDADETGDRTPQMDAAENDASEARVAAGESAYNAAIDAAAMSSPDFSSESVPPMTPERAAEVQTMYARAEAAAATIRAVTRWRAALAGMTSADPDEALNAVWEAGEAYESICNEAY